MKRLAPLLLLALPLSSYGEERGPSRPAIVEPTSTPFDADPEARKEYLAGYNTGHRQIMDAIDNGAFFQRTTDITPEGTPARMLGMKNGAGDALLSTSVWRLNKVQAVRIPLPAGTPFDANADNKAAYLSAYATAYRLVLAEVNSVCGMSTDEPTNNARNQGAADGRKAAEAAHPAKIALILGLPSETP